MITYGYIDSENPTNSMKRNLFEFSEYYSQTLSFSMLNDILK